MSTSIAKETAVIYLTERNNGPPIAAFQEKKIPFLMPGQASDCSIVMTKEMLNIPYGVVMDNLAGYAKAYLTTTYSSMPAQFFAAFKNMKSLPFSFDVPVAQFTFKGLSTDQKSQLTGLGLREGSRANTFVGSPQYEHMATIFEINPINEQADPGLVTPEAYLAYGHCLKAIQLFSSATYDMSTGGYKKITFRVSDVQKMEEDANYRFLDTDRDGTAKNPSWVQGDVDSIACVYGAVFRTFKKGIQSYVVNPDTADNLIDVPGHFFEYFDGMNTVDKDAIVHVFGLRFLNCLGPDAETCGRVWSIVKQGLKKLAYFKAGKALGHAFVGIELAIKAQAIYTPVVKNGKYLGFILQGQFSTFLWNVKEPLASRQKLVDAVKAIDKHTKSLGELLALINAPVNDDGMPIYLYSLSDINTSHKLLGVFLELESSLYDDKDAITAKISELSFGDLFAPPSGLSIITALRYIESGEFGLLSQFPSYIDGLSFERRGRIAVGLSIFGPRSPCLNYCFDGVGTTITFPAPGERDTNLEKVVGGNRPLHYLPFRMLPYRQAVDRYQSMFTSGKVTIPGGRKKKTEWTNLSIVDISIATDPQFTQAYDLIKSISQSLKVGVRAGKRKKDGDSGVRKEKKQKLVAGDI